jgi:hypothetical protein
MDAGNPFDRLTRLAAGFSTDMKLAWRGLWRRKGFLALIVLVLASGLGSAVTGFGLYDAMILKPVPYPEPDRLVQIALAHESRPLEAEPFYGRICCAWPSARMCSRARARFASARPA